MEGPTLDWRCLWERMERHLATQFIGPLLRYKQARASCSLIPQRVLICSAPVETCASGAYVRVVWSELLRLLQVQAPSSYVPAVQAAEDSAEQLRQLALPLTCSQFCVGEPRWGHGVHTAQQR